MPEKPQVIVVDDELEMCTFLSEFLAERGYHARAFTDPEEAIRHYLGDRPVAVILDVVTRGRMGGLQALAAFKKIDQKVPIIILSAQPHCTTVVQAMRLGATDFVAKPFEATQLETPLADAVRQRQLSRHTPSLREHRDSLLFGKSEKMAEVRELIDRVADTDVTVLIRGESGTGKELLARELCAVSLRHNKPFVKVNCAALPAELLESELFGFERGAFTGAFQAKPGKFEFANHGTIFLDEIGEISSALQAKLLQVLQDGEFSRLGGKSDVRVNVRIIAATNRELERGVAEGQFREDLFFRLNVVCIKLPPLRQRREEIPMLADYFLEKYASQYNRPLPPISAETMRLMTQHHWPGNVRELENLCKRAVVLGTQYPIQKELMQSALPKATLGEPELPVPPAPGALASQSLKAVSRTAAREAERELILQMLQRTRWNRKEAAGILGISYKALLYKIKENRLDEAT